jgi:hypothetical protein
VTRFIDDGAEQVIDSVPDKSGRSGTEQGGSGPEDG